MTTSICLSFQFRTVYIEWPGAGPNPEGSCGTFLGSTGRNCSLINLFSMMPMPSIRPKRTAPTTALPTMCFGPLRAAMTAPAAAPLMMEFQGSSFCLRWAKVQSKVEKQRPQAANWPPKTGARSFMRTIPPSALRDQPEGACRAPLIWKKFQLHNGTDI